LHPAEDKSGIATVTDLQSRLFRKASPAARGSAL